MAKNEEKAPDNILELRWGHISLQGIRPSMEDQVVHEMKFTLKNSKCTSDTLSLFAVFDGHGGRQCAEYCKDKFLPILCEYLCISDSVAIAFSSCMKQMDNEAIDFSKDASGSTCCCILIDHKTYDLWCCNIGDSRCISIDNEFQKAIQLSVEHKPDDPLEKKRIEEANGWVTFGRVCGILAVSRSLGDKDFKHEIENLIISTPDITAEKIQPTTKYIILACDGLYDVFTNDELRDWLKQNLTQNVDYNALAGKLGDDAINKRKSKDNVSILIIEFLLKDDDADDGGDINDIDADDADNKGNDDDDDDEDDDLIDDKHSNDNDDIENNNNQEEGGGGDDDANINNVTDDN